MMKITNKKTLNAFLIKLKNTMDSSAIKVLLLIVLIISIGTSFFPYFYNSLFDDKVIVATNPSLNLIDPFVSVEIEDDAGADLVVEERDATYILYVKTEKGQANLPQLFNFIIDINKEHLVRSGLLSQDVINLLRGSNIELVTELDDSLIDDRVVNFIMMLTLIFFLTMTLLTTRIGVQVAAEKGKKVTETILTSITRKQLFFSQALSSIAVTIMSFMVISLPIIVAYFIDDPQITTDFSFFSPRGVVLFLIHLILVSSALVVASIAIGSAVKHTEDANIMTVIVLIPMLISYLYYVFTLGLFKGAFIFLNYIPCLSVFSVMGAILCGTIPLWQTALYCLLDLVFLIIVYFVARKVYCENIS